MPTKLTALAAVAALAAAALLTGCNAPSPSAQGAPGPNEQVAPGPNAQGAPGPLKTTEPAPPVAGDVVLTVAEADAAEAAGLKVYPLETGSIVFDPNAPLPESIQTEIVAPVREALAASGGMIAAQVSRTSKDAAKFASDQLGKNVLIVVTFKGSMTPDGPVTDHWGTFEGKDYSDIGKATLSDTKEETLAKTNAWIAAQPNPTDWLVVSAF